MVSENLPNPYESAVAALREKEARLIAEIEAVRKSIASLETAQIAAGYVSCSAHASLTVDATLVSGTVPALVLDKFKGLGLEQAAAKVLSESDHIELTAKQIWNALSAAGYSLLSDRPEQSVSWALRKRERKVKDVILVGDGKWGMVDWYSQARLKELRSSRNNASTRNSAEHIARTKAGIANAKRNRLQHWGRRRTITAEQMTAAYNQFQRGAKSKLQLAKAANMAWPTFNLYWRQYEMENWRPDDPFPPRRRVVPKENSEIRLENMWPRESSPTNGHAKDDGPQLTLRPVD